MAKFESFGKKRLPDLHGNKHLEPVEFKCYCCQDCGTIPDRIVREYLQDNCTWQDVPFFCRNYGCQGVAQGEEKQDGSGFHPRFGMNALPRMDDRATPELCVRVHQSEKGKRESLRELESEMTNEERATWIRIQLGGIG